jgi:hypothetical protein
LSACLIAAGLLLLAGNGTLSADPPRPTASPPAARVNPGQPTEAECRKWGKALEAAVRKDDLDGFNELVDWNRLVETATGIAGASPGLAAKRAGFIQGVMGSLRSNSTAFGARIAAEARYGSYKLLQVQLVDGRRRAVFRLLMGSGALNYHGFFFDPVPGKPLRAVDCYVFLMGEPLTKSLRRSFLPFVALDRSGMSHLTTADKDIVTHPAEMGELVQLINAKKFTEALQRYRRLPPSMQKSKGMLALRLQAAQRTSEEEYLQAIDAFRKEYPGDVMIDLISLDAYVLRQQFEQALESLNRIDKAVGGDPYLKTLRAAVLTKQGQPGPAQKFAEEAVAEEPTLLNAHNYLLTLSVQNGDFDTTLKELGTLETQFRIKFRDLATVPAYAEFVASPQYQIWLKSHAK